MAAAGIRYVELARELGRRHTVTLAAPEGSSAVPGIDPPAIYGRHDGTLDALFTDTDVVFAQPLAPALLARALRRGVPWVVDMLNPQPFEGLEYHRGQPPLRRRALDVLRIDRIAWACRVGTAFACATERQRDMWLGFLAASRRLDPKLYDTDRELRGLIDLVPSGVSSSPPVAGTPALRGVKVPEDARILLWNGGIWDWFDPLLVLDALARLRAEDERWFVVFQGAGRPSERPVMDMVRRTRERVRELGLGSAVLVDDGWTPYEERAQLLLEADAGVSAHRPSLEARFAYRNRFLDCIWAGLPIVCTAGDTFADEVQAYGWGAVSPPGDAAAFADGARNVVERGRAQFAPALAVAAATREWSTVTVRLEALLAASVAAGNRRAGWLASGMAFRHTTASRLTGR